MPEAGRGREQQNLYCQCLHNDCNNRFTKSCASNQLLNKVVSTIWTLSDSNSKLLQGSGLFVPFMWCSFWRISDTEQFNGCEVLMKRHWPLTFKMGICHTWVQDGFYIKLKENPPSHEMAEHWTFVETLNLFFTGLVVPYTPIVVMPPAWPTPAQRYDKVPVQSIWHKAGPFWDVSFAQQYQSF